MKPICLILNNREPVPLHRLIALQNLLDLRSYQVPEETFSLQEAFSVHHDAEILVVTYMDLTAEHLARVRHLKAIVTTTTAVEYIDKAYCIRNNIAVFNTPSYTGSSVAEYAVGQMFVAAKHFIDSDRQLRRGDFKCFNCQGIELFGKTAGIVGLGHIGTHIARCVHGLGMQVLFHSRTMKDSPIGRQVDLPTLISTSDVVFVAVSLNETSKGLIGPAEIAGLKTNAILVSTSPDAVINLAALKERLHSGGLFAALDLHTPQPNLVSAPNLLLSPRRAWYTQEAFDRRITSWSNTLSAYLAGNPANRVY